MDVRTLVSCGEFLLHHRLEGHFNVAWVWMTCAIVHAIFVDDIVGCVACLKDIESTAHIALGQLQDGLFGGGFDAAAVW